jgi:hypothetical protein
MQVMKLNELLSRAETLDWTYELYLPKNQPWTELTSCAILEPEEDEISNEVASYISQNKFKYILGVQAVQDIVINAKLQRPHANINDLFQAFLYYKENDAFITFR